MMVVERLDTQFHKPTNQNSMEVSKVVKSNEGLAQLLVVKLLYKSLRLSVSQFVTLL